MAGGAETPNVAALPAIARLGACESARGPDADRHVKLLIQFTVEGSLSRALIHSGPLSGEVRSRTQGQRAQCRCADVGGWKVRGKGPVQMLFASALVPG